ncbi:hypothetical protein GCM10025876_21840 [Demequina litorisediminis]|uniref:DNA-directed DNA polymerase n=1 Tax=Demequina litorisediminis TaxID=1849022 RepID=A0ABQ6IDS8_9MICO|nr:hypothetical protein GCM10025876_21840 [Demequina litorisediminis]
MHVSAVAVRLTPVSQALYRRYRPDSFADVVGQEHVTTPLMQALRADKVNHAYLFSGPRGCGKTTSARILARCLNCAEGPTDTPCGVCESCVEPRPWRLRVRRRRGDRRGLAQRCGRCPRAYASAPPLPPRATGTRSSSSTRRTW